MPNLIQRLFEDPDVVRQREQAARGEPTGKPVDPASSEWKKSDTIILFFLAALVIGVILAFATTVMIGFSIAIVLYLVMLLTFMALKD